MTDFQPTQFQPPQQPQQPSQQPPQTPPYLPVQSRQSPISQPIPQQYPYQQQFPPQQYPQQYPPQSQLPPQPPVRAPGHRARLVLVIACALAFAAAALFGVLYVGADGDHDEAVAQLDDRQSQLADVRERLTAAEAERVTAEGRNADLETEHTALKACVDAVQHYLWDGLEGTARDAALDAMFTACQ